VSIILFVLLQGALTLTAAGQLDDLNINLYNLELDA
jgi:hypothetical protein